MRAIPKIKGEKYHMANLKIPTGVLTQKTGRAETANIKPTATSAFMILPNLLTTTGGPRNDHSSELFHLL